MRLVHCNYERMNKWISKQRNEWINDAKGQSLEYLRLSHLSKWINMNQGEDKHQTVEFRRRRGVISATSNATMVKRVMQKNETYLGLIFLAPALSGSARSQEFLFIRATPWSPWLRLALSCSLPLVLLLTSCFFPIAFHVEEERPSFRLAASSYSRYESRLLWTYSLLGLMKVLPQLLPNDGHIQSSNDVARSRRAPNCCVYICGPPQGLLIRM